MLSTETLLWLVEVFIFNAAVFPNIKLDSDIKVVSPLDKGRGGRKKKKCYERSSAFKFIQTLPLTVMNVTLYSTICLMHRPVKFSICRAVQWSHLLCSLRDTR